MSEIIKEEPKTIYCGSGKKKGEGWFAITIDPEVICDYVREYKGKKFIKLNVNVKSKADKFGKDVKVSIDTWEPKNEKDE